MNRMNWNRCVAFHGHACPGLAIGYRAVEWLEKHLKPDSSTHTDETLVCLIENDSCAVDAIQILTQCTIGKGTMVIDMKGKMAFNFFLSDHQESVRLLTRPFDEKKTKADTMDHVLNMPLEQLFEFKCPDVKIPKKARIYQNTQCQNCEEPVAEPFTVTTDEKTLCLDCAHTHASQ